MPHPPMIERHSSYLLLNGLRFHYLHWKPKDDGLPLVLLHGLASNARIWELTAPLLAEAGYRPLAWDARGHGLTDKPEQGYNTPTFLSDLAAFIEASRLEAPVLVGHSWGASLALAYAAQFPFGQRAPAGMVLVDGGVVQMDQTPGATWESIQERLAPPRLEGTAVDDFLGKLNGWTASWRASEAVPAILLANFEVRQDETIAPHLTYERHMAILRSIWELQTYTLFERLRCPVRAILAQPSEPLAAHERAFLENKRRSLEIAQRTIERFDAFWLENTVHDVPLQRPTELAGLIAGFVQGLP